ncbi:phosphoglycolate phosphatase [Fontibacillus panacisegetis]|uniref:Phosphoglycolate phosphatase n=1 Tax=Fontibacillus panacisegetis TaxID=670482 RepID=A0A1G7NYD8_9BACL|nr:HAD family hydrolase [Fontibacillus panacisegetis]SDF78993.1 phosphoglycolate phosphatase [Fontibacillus panacisegetis]
MRTTLDRFYSHVLFDLDGTLTDPKLGITKSVQYALHKFGIEVNDLDQLNSFIGPPLMLSFRDLYGFTEGDANQAIRYYREYFQDQGMYENELYNGMIELLSLLKKQNRTLVVATSKPTVFTEQILSYFHMDSFFDVVCGSELDGTRSDKAEIIHYILEHQQIGNDAAVMIGDRKFDIIGANHQGVDAIAVGYGYGSKNELMESSPKYYVESVEELYALFI